MEPPATTVTTSVPETTPADTTPATPAVTATATVTYRPAPGSPFQCEVPGPARDEDHCNKFWLCQEQTEGSQVLEVKC